MLLRGELLQAATASAKALGLENAVRRLPCGWSGARRGTGRGREPKGGPALTYRASWLQRRFWSLL